MKKLILTATLVSCVFFVFSQSEKKETDQFYCFGFNFGANYSFLQSKEQLPNNSEIYNGIGGKFGFLMDYHFTKHFMISPKAELSFNRSGIKTTNTDNTKSTYNVFPMSLDIMTHFVIKNGESRAFPYLLIGPNLRLPLKNKSYSNTEFRNNLDLAMDFGIGLQNKLKYFVLAPEIRYSLGLLNINKNPTFQTLNYHNLSLVLNFK